MEQLAPSMVLEDVCSTTEDLVNKVLVEEKSLSTTEGEEVASKGSGELRNYKWEEEPQKGFSSPRDQGNAVKFPGVELGDSELVNEFLKDCESLRDQGSAVRPPSVESL